MSLYYAPGEAYRFDWSQEIVLIGDVTTTVKVPHFRLCHSHMMFARAYMCESLEMVFDAHDRAFAFSRAPARAVSSPRTFVVIEGRPIAGHLE